MTCKDCIHSGLCYKENDYANFPNKCGSFVPDRPQGEWIVTAEDNDGVHRICCPFCSYEKGSNNMDPIVVTFTKFPKFCENCGANLRGKE